MWRLGPTHTPESVAATLAAGLENGTIVLWRTSDAGPNYFAALAAGSRAVDSAAIGTLRYAAVTALVSAVALVAAAVAVYQESPAQGDRATPWALVTLLVASVVSLSAGWTCYRAGKAMQTRIGGLPAPPIQPAGTYLVDLSGVPDERREVARTEIDGLVNRVGGRIAELTALSGDDRPR